MNENKDEKPDYRQVNPLLQNNKEEKLKIRRRRKQMVEQITSKQKTW